MLLPATTVKILGQKFYTKKDLALSGWYNEIQGKFHLQNCGVQRKKAKFREAVETQLGGRIRF